MTDAGDGFSDATFAWFAGLEANNDRAWFTENRDAFTEHVDEPFTRLLEDVTTRLVPSTVPLVGGAATTFRMNRDVRFSADKSPYATYRAGLLTPNGTKTESAGLVYVRLDSSGGFLAGGLSTPSSAQLEPARQALLSDPHGFAAVVTQLGEHGLQLDRSGAVKTMPRGYSQHSNDALASFLQLKQYVVTRPLTRRSWLGGEMVDEVSGFAVSIAPLLTWVRTTQV